MSCSLHTPCCARFLSGHLSTKGICAPPQLISGFEPELPVTAPREVWIFGKERGLLALPGICINLRLTRWAGWLSRYSDWLRAGRSRDRIPVVARFSAPVQTGPGAHPASCTMGTGSFPGVKSGRGATLTPHPLLVPWSRKSRAIPLLPLWTVRPVQSLSACTTVHFTFYLFRLSRR